MGDVVPDPNVTVGVYKILRRTDGQYVVVHQDLPRDGSVCAVRPTLEAATREAERLTKLGSPCVIVNPLQVESRPQRIAHIPQQRRKR